MLHVTIISSKQIIYKENSCVVVKLYDDISAYVARPISLNRVTREKKVKKRRKKIKIEKHNKDINKKVCTTRGTSL